MEHSPPALKGVGETNGKDRCCVDAELTLMAETTLPRAGAWELPSDPSVPPAQLPPHSARAGAAKTTAVCRSRSWELRSPMASCWQSVSCKCPLPGLRAAHRHMLAGDGAVASSCLTRALCCHAPVTVSKPSSPPKAPTNAITLGLGLQMCRVGGGRRGYRGDQ